ncbi:heme oxygenase-like protein [Chiua virens]|nr:heme oxygenase-like protein [Chiua virens]
MNSLTDHLTALTTPTPYNAAIAHPFLKSAGNLSLPAIRLALYLSQDRIYAAQAYPRFIAQLITKIPLDDPKADPLATRTLTLLVGCLTNIVREVAFFDTTARTYNLPLAHRDWRERKATRDYTAEMARVGALTSLEEGLVFLWAMEKVCSIATVRSFARQNRSQVYLDAWSTVYHSLPEQSITEAGSQADLTAKAIRDLSYNWSNPDFVQFVQDIGVLVNDYFTPVMEGQYLAGRSASDALGRAEAIWARVVELEAEFWPDEGEEDTLLWQGVTNCRLKVLPMKLNLRRWPTGLVRHDSQGTD